MLRRNLLPCIVSWLLLVNTARAQTVSLGIVGGTSGTTLSGDKPSRGSFKAGAGYHLGAQLEITVGNHVGFRLQPMFMSRSVKLEVKDNGDPPSKRVSRLEMESLTLPVTIHYAVGSRTTRVFAETGGEFHSLQNFFFFEDGLPERDLRDATESFEAAVLIGFGVQSRWGSVPWFAQLRYSTGLTNLAAGDPLLIGLETTRWKSRSMQLLLGVSYTLFGD